MCFRTSLSTLFHVNLNPLIEIHSAIEQERLDAQAAAIVEMIGGCPFLATSLQSRNQVAKAVDIGCGTGIATIQIANLFPSAMVYGLDISAVPEEIRKLAPQNVAWVEGNILDVDHEKPRDEVISQDVFTPAELDYIFGRMLFLGVTDWSKYFSTTYHSMRSGGIIEHQDLDWKFYRVGTSECLSDEWEWHRSVISAAEKTGLSTRAGSNAAKLMEDAGFEVVRVETFEFSFVPSNKMPSSQAMGQYVLSKLLPQYPELLRKMLGPHGDNGQELERLTKQCLSDITSEEGVHQKYTVTIARKP